MPVLPPPGGDVIDIRLSADTSEVLTVGEHLRMKHVRAAVICFAKNSTKAKTAPPTPAPAPGSMVSPTPTRFTPSLRRNCSVYVEGAAEFENLSLKGTLTAGIAGNEKEKIQKEK